MTRPGFEPGTPRSKSKRATIGPMGHLNNKGMMAIIYTKKLTKYEKYLWLLYIVVDK